MGNYVSTGDGNGFIANPLSGLIDGMLKGHALAYQIKNQAMQEEAHQRAMADADRQAQVKDIQIRCSCSRTRGPVARAGQSRRQWRAPVLAPAAPGAVDCRKLAGQLDPLAGQTFVRPVDKSRKVTLSDRMGNPRTTAKLYTPEEQMQRQTQAAGGSSGACSKTRRPRPTWTGTQIADATLRCTVRVGVPAMGLTLCGIPDGTQFTHEEYANAAQKAAQIRKEGCSPSDRARLGESLPLRRCEPRRGGRRWHGSARNGRHSDCSGVCP